MRWKWFGLGRDEGGAAAIEFAIAGSVFLLLACFTLELGLIRFTQAALDNAARDASRLILTGQVQVAGGSATPFTTQLCNDLHTLVPCTSIQYDVQSATTFSTLNATVSTTAAGNMTNNAQFSPGGPGSDVLVQVGYNRPEIIPWVAKFFGATHSTLLVSTVAIQNEPYQ